MTPPPDGLTLRLERVIPAPPTRVFAACTEPGQLAEWWGPRGFSSPSVDFNPRVGGSYRIAMQPPEGEPFHLGGEFHEVDPPNRLAYTFVWDPPADDDRETLATLSFGDQGESTELLLEQTGFATEERRALHESGWTDSLDRLQEFLSG